MSKMIQLSLKHQQQINNHAAKTYPEECCGLLLGKFSAQQKILIEVIETENSWKAETDSIASKRNRFTIAPELILKAQKQARDRDLSIIGVYHSHPDHPAIPSEFDRAIAWSEYSYIIVSVREGIPQEFFSWTLNEQQQFQSENVTFNS